MRYHNVIRGDQTNVTKYLRSSLIDFEYVIVIAQVAGIYGSKQTESKGVARGRGLFTTAINSWPPVL